MLSFRGRSVFVSWEQAENDLIQTRKLKSLKYQLSLKKSSKIKG